MCVFDELVSAESNIIQNVMQ